MFTVIGLMLGGMAIGFLLRSFILRNEDAG